MQKGAVRIMNSTLLHYLPAIIVQTERCYQ